MPRDNSTVAILLASIFDPKLGWNDPAEIASETTHS